MKAELSQIGLYLSPHYSGVYQQQGRMLLDRDWNELCDVLRHLGRVAASEAIGTGVPRHDGLLTSPAANSLSLSGNGGLVAADGVIGEIRPRDTGAAINLYLNQRDLPATVPNPSQKLSKAELAPAPPSLEQKSSKGDVAVSLPVTMQKKSVPLLSAGPMGMAIYVDIWERTVNAFEQPDLVDPALHGADTCLRTQRMTQIKSANLSASDVDPTDPCLPILKFPKKGNAEFDAQPTKAGETADNCDPCADQVAIARVVPNRLFRVEVHSVQFTGHKPTGVTLKWSLDNGAREFKSSDYAMQADPTTHSYEFFSTDTEKLLGMPSDDWPAEALLRGALDPSDPVAAAKVYPRVREWDGWCQLALSAGAWSVVANAGRYAGQALGTIATVAANVLTIQFADQGFYFTLSLLGKDILPGDYWLVLMRTRAAESDRLHVVSKMPLGVEHRYCLLGPASTAANTTSLIKPSAADLRRLQHPALTCLDAADVSYTPTCKNGFFTNDPNSLDPPYTVKSALDHICDLDAEHVAFSPECGYLTTSNVKTVGQALEALCTEPAQFVPYKPGCDYLTKAGVKDVAAALDALCAEPAQFVPYQPGCDYLTKAGVKDVAAALDALCRRFTLKPLPRIASTNWANNSVISFAKFLVGLSVTFTEPIYRATLNENMFIVTFEASYRLQSSDFVDETLTPQIVIGSVEISADNLTATFIPNNTAEMLGGALSRMAGDLKKADPSLPGIRCRVRIPGRAVFDAAGVRALDGFVPMLPKMLTLSVQPDIVNAAAPASTEKVFVSTKPLAPAFTVDFDFPNSGIGQVSDFESWFFLLPPPQNGGGHVVVDHNVADLDPVLEQPVAVNPNPIPTDKKAVDVKATKLTDAVVPPTKSK